jgi:hypothetical protein
MKTLGVVILALLLAGCSMLRPNPIVLPPQIIKVPTFVPLPEECKRLQALPMPPGTTAEQALSAQHSAILAYESQVRRCFMVLPPVQG